MMIVWGMIFKKGVRIGFGFIIRAYSNTCGMILLDDTYTIVLFIIYERIVMLLEYVVILKVYRNIL